MHDSLDLDELERQSKGEKRKGAPQPKWVRLISYLVGALIVGIGALMYLVSQTDNPSARVLPSMAALGLLLVLCLIGTGVLLYSIVQMFRTHFATTRRLDAQLEHLPPLKDKPQKQAVSPAQILITLLGLAGLIGWIVFDFPFLFILAPIGFVYFFVVVVLEAIAKSALERGKYGVILKIADFLAHLGSRESLIMADVTAMRGLALLFMDRLDESIAEFRWHLHVVRRSGDARQVALALNNLGYALVLAGYYDEALPLLETALRVLPSLGNAYDSLATLYLEQGILPERALELTQMALQRAPLSPQKIVRGIQLATCACAYGLTGQVDEAYAAVEEALTLVNEAPLSAEIFRQAGWAMHAVGDIDTAYSYFQRAVELDPNGLFGRLSREALQYIAQEKVPDIDGKMKGYL
jgi:Tfp pilus assembly protein PilF